ncbi:MAG: response regulator [Gammaproteobacteria bacterium]|nr:response regulator [Gammaproteobacteria bacterium]
MTNRKVLIVDDSPVDRENLKSILSGTGCLVLTASDGAESVARAKAEKPDVIFMDVIMPEMDGFEACRRLRKDDTTKDIPIVFVTSKNQKADRVWAQMQGAKALLSKPYTKDQIIEQLEALS